MQKVQKNFISKILALLAVLSSFLIMLITTYCISVTIATFRGTLSFYGPVIPDWILLFLPDRFTTFPLSLPGVFLLLLLFISLAFFLVFQNWKRSLLLFLFCVCSGILGFFLTFFPFGGVLGFYHRAAYKKACETEAEKSFKKQDACMRLEGINSFL